MSEWRETCIVLQSIILRVRETCGRNFCPQTSYLSVLASSGEHAISNLDDGKEQEGYGEKENNRN